MQSFGVRLIFDATHSAQRPGGLGKSTGGARPVIPRLARAAVAAGCDGLFMECHPDPQKALSDATTQLPLSLISSMVRELVELKRWTSQHPFPELQ
jgi:2-dehydro-3-deoxyphosphooctonate aldolase (KDO 8-P synthase)